MSTEEKQKTPDAVIERELDFQYCVHKFPKTYIHKK